MVWLLRNHPELKDSQIMRLVGTTKPTIAAIRDRTHWNSPNLTPQDPVTLGLCSQTDLDAEVHKAARRLERERKEQHKPLEKAGTLLPTSETIPGLGPQPVVEILPPREAEKSPWRRKPRSRRACSPSCARWAAPRRKRPSSSAGRRRTALPATHIDDICMQASAAPACRFAS